MTPIDGVFIQTIQTNACNTWPTQQTQESA